MPKKEKHEGLSFREAMRCLENGKTMSREAWKGTGLVLWMMPHYEQCRVSSEWRPELQRFVKKFLKGKFYSVPAAIFEFDGKTLACGWRPDDADVEANDWYIAAWKI